MKAVLPRVPGGWLALWLFLLTACGSPPATDPDAPGGSHFDFQRVSLDLATPSYAFDGRGGSLLAGEGWDVSQLESVGDRVVPYAWAIDDTASLWLGVLPTTTVDLLGTCQPLVFPGAPPQEVSVHLADQLLGRQVLEAGWQDLRIPLAPLPSSLPEEGGWLHLQLRFAYAERPKDVLPGDADGRRLAIACRRLSLVPRDRLLPSEPSFDPSKDRWRLPLGTAVGRPIPAGGSGHLHLDEVRTACDTCPVRISLYDGESDHLLWQGTVQEVEDLDLPFVTSSIRPGQLRIRFGESSDLPSAPSTSGPIHLGFNWDHQIRIAANPSSPGATKADSAEPSRPHLFVYLIDTLRADALAPYGASDETTPAIAAFAQDAVTYQAWSASAWTLPSVVSILTGIYPGRHGVQRGDTRFDGETFSSLAEHLTDADYDTVGISQSLIASHRFGLDRGFRRFYQSNQLNGHALRSQELRRFFWLDLLHRPDPKQPLFAYLHSVGPHAPYAPEGEDRRYAEQHPGNLDEGSYLPQVFLAQRLTEATEVAHLQGLYRGEVAYADRQFGHFLDQLRVLGLYEDSLVVLLSDHGEEFAEHGGFDHGRTPYEEMLKVPLLVKYPRSQGGGLHVGERVSTVDLVPTLLDAAGVTLPPALDGRVLPRPFDPSSGGRRAVVAHVNPAPRNNIAVRYDVLAIDPLKCVLSHTGHDQFGTAIPTWQIFDLATDPTEQSPLLEDSTEGRRCLSLWDQWQAAQEALQQTDLEQTTSKDLPTPQLTDEATRDQLRSLGYID